MKFKTALLVLSLAAAPAFASDPSAPKTREQVRAELFQAIASGDMLGGGETSMKLNQINPRLYPSAKPVGTPKTRSQVVTELEQAIKIGDVMAAGESGAKLNEIAPASYPVQATAGQSKSREQVKQELAEAIRKRPAVPP